MKDNQTSTHLSGNFYAIWCKIDQLVTEFEQTNDVQTLMEIVSQYDSTKHESTLKAFFTECLERNDLDNMKKFLRANRKAYHLVYYNTNLTDNGYDSPFFTIRAFVEWSLWNNPHTLEMDKIIVDNNAFLVTTKPDQRIPLP